MYSMHEDLSGGLPCVSQIQLGASEFALSYSHEHCVTGFKVTSGGYWVLENFLGSGKWGCVAATYDSTNFYVAMCGGTTDASCKGVTVPDQPDKKCLDGWMRETVS